MLISGLYWCYLSLDGFTYLDDVKIQAVNKEVETIDIKAVAPIGIDDLKVSFYLKNLIVDGLQYEDDRS